MLKALNRIDLSLPLRDIQQEIDKVALSKEIGALLKTNLVKKESGEGVRWLVNIPLLAHQGYDSIANYSLAEGHPKQWHKPVEYIYGGKSNYYDNDHHRRYCENYPQMNDQNFHGVKEAGHWVHADRPAEFMQILEKIVSRDDGLGV
jgi:pimeloyl-ACP methyl ester carboxylesterase